MGDLRAWASQSGFLENPTEDATEKRTSAIQMDANQKDSAVTTGSSGLRGWAEQSGFINSASPLETQPVKDSEQSMFDAVSNSKPMKFAKDLYTGLSDTGTQMKGAVAASIEGNDPEEIVRKDWKDEAITEAKQSAKGKALSGNAGNEEYFLGITRNKVRNLSQNLSFSLVSMGAGIIAGTSTGTATAATGVGAPAAPVVGWSAGAAASGLAAYRMDTNGFLRDLREQLDAASEKTRGKPLSDDEFVGMAKNYESLAREHGLWEAIPEALGNVVGVGAGKLIFKEAALGIKGLVKSTAVAGGDLAVELGTETVTQTGQHNVEVDAGMSNAPKRSFTSMKDLAKSAEEVLPDVLLLTGVTQGGAYAAGKAKDAYDSNPNRQIAKAIQEEVDRIKFTEEGIDRDARAGMDPNRDIAIDPSQTSKPIAATVADSVGTAASGAGVAQSPGDEQQQSVADQHPVDRMMGQGQTVEQTDAAHPVDNMLSQSQQEDRHPVDNMLEQSGEQQQQTQTAVPVTETASSSTSAEPVAQQVSQPVAGDVTSELDQQLADIDKEAEAAAKRTPVTFTDAQGNTNEGYQLANGDIAITKDDGTEYTIPQTMAGNVQPKESGATEPAKTATEQTDAQQTVASPVVKAATDQINRGFGLEEGESVVIDEVKGNKRLDTFARAIKDAFGVDVAFVSFGKDGVLRTTKGRTFAGGRYNGYRVAGQNAILVDANSAKFLDTLGHELTHVLEEQHPEIYRTLVSLAKTKVPETKQQFLRNALNKSVAAETNGRETAVSQREFESELVAYMVGEQSRSEAFWADVFQALGDKTLVDQLMELLNKIVDAIKAATKSNPSFIKDRGDALAVQKAAAAAFKQWIQEVQAATASETTPATPQPAAESKAQPAVEQQQTGQFDREVRTYAGVTETPFDKLQFSLAEKTYLNAVTEDPQGLIRDYIERFGRNVNPDLARELSPFYDLNPARYAAAVHEPSSMVAKMVYDHTIETAQGSDRVVFLAGGGGSGKGYMASKLGIVHEGPRGIEVPVDGVILYDAVMGKFISASARIEQALTADLKSELFYINTPAINAFRNALKRALTSRRVVPMKVLAEAHAGASATVKELYKEYGNIIDFNIISNNNGEPYRTDISSVPVYNTNQLYEQFQEELERQVNEGYPEELAAGFARTSFARDLGEWTDEANDKRIVDAARAVRSKAGRSAATDGEGKRTKQRSAGEVVPRQDEAVVEEKNPLLDYVAPEEAEGRIRRREARNPGVGAPVNDRTILKTKDGKRLVVGQITKKDWLDRVTSNMDANEIQDSRTWYRQLHDSLSPIFGNDAPRYALAWLLSQQRASPTKGMTDVLRAADMAQGKPEIKKAGLNQAALISVLQGEVPKAGIGAKLMDFLDSELGKSTRTIVRNDPRGRQPAAIDVWAQRDVGFIDPTVYEYIRKNFGEQAVEQLDIDKTTSGEAQYEYGLDFYNDVAEYLNAKEFDGGGWTAREVQAVGWVTMQKQMGIKAEFVRDIIAGNTRRVSIGLAAGTGSVMEGKLAGKEIPTEVAQREISHLAKLAGVNIIQNAEGVGAYLSYIEGAIQIDAFASPEAVDDFMDMVGYAFQQTEVINTRPLQSGKNSAIDFFSPELKTVDQATSFFGKFLESAPKNKDGELLAPGFQQVQRDGQTGIRLLNFAGKWSKAELALIEEALVATANGIGLQSVSIDKMNVVLSSTKNDWTENRNGESYIENLRNRGRLSEARELQRRYVPSRFDIAGDGTLQFSRELGPDAASSGRDQGSTVEAEGIPEYGRATEGSVSVRGVHYSRQIRPVLLSDFHGSGLKGAEARRLAETMDARLKKRIYFYVDNGKGIRPEAGVGSYPHQVKLNNIYDANANRTVQSTIERGLTGNDYLNAFEAAVIDAGYDGYVVDFGISRAAVLIGKHAVETGKEPVTQTRGYFSREIVEQIADGGVEGLPDILAIGEVPPVLRAVGIKSKQPLVIEATKIVKIVNPESRGKNVENEDRYGRFVAKRIALSVDELMKVPDWIANPVAILKSAPNASRQGLVVVLPFIKGGAPVIAALHPDVRVRGGGDMRVTDIASVYPKNQTVPGKSLSSMNALFTPDNILYYNKVKAVAMVEKMTVGMPNMVSVGDRLNPKTVLPQDIMRLVKEANDAFRMKRFPQTQFSREVSMAEDFQGQEQFLQQRAEQAGYQNVDEWAATDIAGFMKAATEWREQNPADMLFARNLDRPLQGDKFVLPVRSLKEKVANRLVDSMSRVAEVQKAVVKQGGMLTEKTNVSDSLQRAYNRAGFQLETFRRQTLEPLLERIAKDGLDMSDVAILMYAKHAKEANSYIAMINASFPDAGSGMSNADAAHVIAELKKRPDFKKLEAAADSLQDITKMTQDVLLEGGLVDQDMLNRWNAHYSYYVPLRGFEQVDTDVDTTKGGKGTGAGVFDLAGSFTKRRLGRSSRATNLVENIINDYERAVAAAERNKVRQTFLAWVTMPANRDSVLWQVNRPALQPQYRKNQLLSPMGYVVGEVNYVQTVENSPTTTVPVRHNGIVYHISVLDKGMHEDLEMTTSKDSMLLHVMSIVGKPMRILSKLWTMYSPEFMFTNAQRDAEMALSSLGVEHGLKIGKDTFKRVPKMAWRIWRTERGSTAVGGVAFSVGGKDYTYGDLYNMYREDGGKVGTMDLKTLEDRELEIQRAMKQAQASIKNPLSYHRLALRYVQNIEDYIGDLNGAIEQMYRVAAYGAILENGGTREQATKVAMNLTVNFSRKGKWTPLLSPFYLFLNPSVQSVVKVKELLTTKKGAALAASLVGLGVAVALMNKGNAGDDDKDYWDLEANQDVKLKNLVWFDAEGNRHTIPLFYGLGFFVNLGYTMVDVGTGNKDLGQATRFMANAFTTHFSPLGAMDNAATFVSPTLLDPIIVMASGKRENGMPLMPEQPAYGAPKPESERYWNSTKDTVYQKVSAWLNELGGGSAAVPGKLGPFSTDISPEKLKYAANYVAGGAGSFIASTAETLDLYFNVDKNAPIEKNTIPFVRKFYQTNTGKSEQIQFYKNRDDAMQALAEWKLFQTNPDVRERADVAERVADNQRVAQLGAAVQNYNDALSNIAKMERMETAGDKDSEQKYVIHEKYEQMRQRLYVQFNRQFFQAKE